MVDILINAGLLDPRYASPAWQEHCAAHFRPPVDLGQLETAQRQYRELREMLAVTLPLPEWLHWVKSDTAPEDAADLTTEHYRKWVAALDGMIAELERQFGAELLSAALSIDDQRKRPN